MRIFLYLLLIQVAQAQTYQLDEKDISFEFKPKSSFWGLVDDGVDIKVSGNSFNYSTYLGSFSDVTDAQRSIGAFINRQKILAKTYGKKIVIDEKAAKASKPLSSGKTPYDEIKALFSVKEIDEANLLSPQDCMMKLGKDGMSDKLKDYFFERELILVNKSDITFKYVMAESILCDGCAGVFLDVFIGGKLIYSMHFKGSHSSKNDVLKTIQPYLNWYSTQVDPILLDLKSPEKRSSGEEEFKALLGLK